MVIPLTTCTLSGMPDTTGPKTAAIARTLNSASRLLRDGRIVTFADDCGSFTIWKGETDGIWHCEFNRWRMVLDHSTFQDIGGAIDWLKQWWPALSSYDYPAKEKP